MHLMREGTLRLLCLEGRPPGFVNLSPGILPRLGTDTKIGQHGVDGSLERLVPLPDRLLHPFPLSVGPQPLELLVRVENQCRPRETPRITGTVGVHPDDVQRLTAKAE